MIIIKKVIEIDLINKDDFFEKYNTKIVSRDLINYIIDSVPYFGKEDKIKIVINNQIKDQESCIPLIVEGLKREYNKNIFTYYRNNFVQIFYLIIGIILLFISRMIAEETIREVVLIWGWVLVWVMAETEIFADINNRKKRKIINKILNSEMIENKL